MKKRLNIKKVMTVLVAVFIFVSLTLTLILQIYFDGERLRELVIPQIEQNLGREVKIGEIGLRIWSGLGVEINDFRIVNEAGFEQNYLAQFDSFKLELAWRPLLRREVEIAEVSIARPEIYLETDEQGSNYQFLTELAAGEAEGSGQSIGLDISLDNLVLTDGRINYINYSQQQEVELAGIDLATGLNLKDGILTSGGQLSVAEINLAGFGGDDLALSRLDFLVEQKSSFDLATGEADFEQLDFKLGDLNLSSQASILLGEDEIELKDFSATTGGSSLNLVAKLNHFTEPRLDFKLKSELKLAELLTDLDLGLEADLAGQISLDLAGREINLEQLEQIHDLKGEVKLNSLALSSGELATDIKDFSTVIRLDKDQILAEQFNLEATDSFLAGSLEIMKWQEVLSAAMALEDDLPGQIRLKLNSDRLALEEIIEAAELQQEISGQDDKDNELYLPNLDLTLAAELNNLAYQDSNDYNLSSIITTEAGIVKLEQILVNTADTSLELTGLADYKKMQRSGDYEDLLIDLQLFSNLDLAVIETEFRNFLPEFEAYSFKGESEIDLKTEFLLADILAEDLSGLEEIFLEGVINLSATEIYLPEIEPVKLDNLTTEISITDKQLSLAGLNLSSDYFVVNEGTSLKISEWKPLLVALIKEQQELPGQIDLLLKADYVELEQLIEEFDLADNDQAEAEFKLPEEFYLPSANLTAQVEIEQLGYQQNYYQLSNDFSLTGSQFINRLELRNPEQIKLDLYAYGDYENIQVSKQLEDLKIGLEIDSKLDLARAKTEFDSFNQDYLDYKVSGNLEAELKSELLLAELLKDEIDDLSGLNLTGSVKLVGVEVEDANHLLEEPARLDLLTNFATEEISISDLNLAIADSDLAGEIKLTAWHDLALLATGEKKELSQIDFNLSSTKIVIDKLSDLADNFLDPEADSESKLDLDELTDLLANFAAKGSLEVAEVSFEDFRATELDLTANFAELVAEVTELNFNYAGGEVKTSLLADLSEEISYYGDLDVQAVQANQLLSQFSSFSDHLYGAIDLDGEFAGGGIELEDILQQFNLRSQALIKEGRLEDWVVVDKLNQWFNIFSGDSLSFKELKGGVKIVDGELILPDMVAQTDYGELGIVGSSTLAGELDYNLSYLLSAEARENINLVNKEFYLLNNREIRLDFELKGQLNQPEFNWLRPDFSQQIEQRRKEAEDKAKEEIEKQKDKLEDELKDRIRGWF